MKSITKVILGILLIIIGFIVGINALGIADIDIFFDGWWTLFIIIPSFIGLFDGDDKQGSLTGLIIGILLLLATRDIINFDVIIKLLIPIILVSIGISVIANEISGNKVNQRVEKISSEDMDSINAIFSEEKRLVESDFKNSVVDAVFGHVLLDLSKAKIGEETIIKASAIFGGIDLILPHDVTVKIKSTKIFGGVDKTGTFSDKNKKEKIVYIDAFIMFGGINIK